MNKFVKIALAGCALAAVLLIALVLLVRLLVTPERVKAVILPLAEQALQRQVTLETVKVGLFSGIELHGLVIDEPGDHEPFVAADRVLLRFQWLPLLARRVVIDEVSLERPLIQIIRHADGSFNVSTLLAAPASPEVAAKADAGQEDSPFSVLVSTVQVHAGRLIFDDRQHSVRTELSELQLDASGITRVGTVPVKLSARLQGALLQIDGMIRPLQKDGSLHIDLNGLDVVAFAPYYRDQLPGQLSRLKISLQGELSKEGKAVVARGKLQGSELDLTLSALPEAPLHNARIDADYAVGYHLERDHLDISALTVTFNGLAARLSGSLASLTTAPAGELELVLPGVDLAGLKQALPPVLLGKAAAFDLAGTLQGSLSLRGPIDQPLLMIQRGDVTLAQVQGSLAGMRPTFDGRIVLTREAAELQRMTARLGEVRADFAGRIVKPLEHPVADITVTLPRVELATALAKVPAEMLAGLAGFAPAGQIEARARLHGALAKPQTLLHSAEVNLHGVEVTVGGARPAFTGRLQLAGDRLDSTGLSVQLGRDTAQLKLAARDLFGRVPVVTADVAAPRLPIEVLLGSSVAGAPAAAPPPAAGADAPGLDLPLQISGNVRIGETAWQGLTVNNLAADYALRDNQLTLGAMTGQVAGGSFRNTARIDLGKPGLAYVASLDLQGVQAEPLLKAFAPAAAGHLSGALTMQLAVNGSGTRWETISRTLSGDGTLTFRDGRLTSPALVNGLAAFLQLPDLGDINFREFHGKARIVDGRAEIDSSLSGRQLKLFPRGSLGLDGSISLAMDTRLSPELTARLDRRGQVTRYLLDAEGWGQLPLLVSGTLQAPRFGLDPKGVQAQGTRLLQQEVQRGLDKLLGAPPPPPVQPAEPASGEAGPEGAPDPTKAPPPPAEPVSPARKLLEETLQRALGR
jgi:AsmA protein